jgi:acyl-coenzyme A synthetase/AMP-(fatty) acid ligase
MSLFDPIAFHGRTNPDRLALAVSDAFAESATYGDLLRAVHRVARRFETASSLRASRVGIVCQNRLLQIAAALGASLAGVRGILISPDGSFPRADVDAFVTDSRDTRVEGQVIQIDGSIFSPGTEPEKPSARNGETRWRFLPSTAQRVPGTPYLTEAVLEARIQQRSRATGGAGDRWLCVADIRGERGFTSVAAALSSGGAALLSNGHWEDDCRMMGLYEAGSVFIAAGLLADYLPTIRAAAMHGMHPRVMVISGTAFDDKSLVWLKREISPHISLHLDCPEIGTFAASTHWQLGERVAFWPLTGTECLVVDNDGRPMAPGTTGTILVKSAGAAAPEPGDPAAGRFRDGWFISPWMGSQLPTGALLLSGAREATS